MSNLAQACVLPQAPAMRRMLDRYAVNDQLVANHGMGVATVMVARSKAGLTRPTPPPSRRQCSMTRQNQLRKVVPSLRQALDCGAAGPQGALACCVGVCSKPCFRSCPIPNFGHLGLPQRRSCWPASRACDDLLHFSQKKHTTLASQCTTFE